MSQVRRFSVDVIKLGVKYTEISITTSLVEVTGTAPSSAAPSLPCLLLHLLLASLLRGVDGAANPMAHMTLAGLSLCSGATHDRE